MSNFAGSMYFLAQGALGEKGRIKPGTLRRVLAFAAPHGVTGIGWSLHKLARATGDARHLRTAKGAFAFEDSLFDVEEQNWLDLRELGGPKTGRAWCHGAVGIALARLDLDPHLTLETTRASLRAAAATAWKFGFGWSHCACHGSLGVWGLLDRAIAEGLGPEGL